MPQNLDDATKKIVLLVSSFTTLAIAVPALWAHFIKIPHLQRQLQRSQTHHAETKPSLLAGCLATTSLLLLATAIATWPVVAFLRNDEPVVSQQQTLSSSINFCEEDFRHSRFLAEPANAISSLTCYVPLALFGLVRHHPASAQYRGTTQFVIVYVAVLCIGVGSTALHALLTAEAQGGDELPMLWFTAAAAYCALDVILHRQGSSSSSSSSSSRCQRWLLAGVVVASAIAATVTYVARRDDFAIFYIMFSLYSQIMVFSIIWIAFGIQWAGAGKEEEGVQFKATVLFPLAIAVGWTTVTAVWVWVSEMLFCNTVMRDRAFGDVIAPFVWNRVVHPMWHALSGLMAWLLVQVLLAAHGMQQGWGTPSLEWLGAPYVVFHQQQSSMRSKQE